jgi:F0F1-type ATP synthase membrane subunit b/b'
MSNLFAEGYKEGMDISQQLSRAEALKAKSTLAIDQAEQNLAQSKTQQDISKQELEQLKQKTKELERAVTPRS